MSTGHFVYGGVPGYCVLDPVFGIPDIVTFFFVVDMFLSKKNRVQIRFVTLVFRARHHAMDNDSRLYGPQPPLTDDALCFTTHNEHKEIKYVVSDKTYYFGV